MNDGALAAETVAVLTGRPCVLYRIYSKDDVLLYVGISTGPASRIKQHETDKPWWTEVARIDVEQFSSADDALAAERKAIVDEKPVHNISGGRRTLSEEERAQRAADQAEQAAYEDSIYRPRDTTCTNCGQPWHEIPRGTLIADAVCEVCGCHTLERSANGP